MARQNIRMSWDRQERVISDELVPVMPEELQHLTERCQEAARAEMLTPILKGNLYRPAYTAADIVSLDHAYGREQFATHQSLEPCCSQWPSDELSPHPLLSDDYQFMLTSLQEGARSGKVKGLPVCESPTRQAVHAPAHSGNLTTEQEQLLVQKHVCLSQQGCTRIELATQSQRQSEVWHRMRRLRLTASNCGRVINRRKSLHPTSLLTSLFSTKQVKSPAIQWGICHEEDTVNSYEQSSSFKTESCGLFINCKYCWLAASPDRTVCDEPASDGLLEVKCPYGAREKTVLEYGSEQKSAFYSIKGGKFPLDGTTHITIRFWDRWQ